MNLKVLAIALGLVVGSAPVWAQADDNARVPRSRAEIRLSYAPLVKRAAPAVVNIYTKRVVQSRLFSPFQSDPFFKRFFGENFSMGRSRKKIENSLGSGVIVRANGLIVTNHHVINKADEITVILADRREFDTKVVSDDERTDLAVLKIDPGSEKLPSLEMRDSDDLEVGDLVLAIGNPFGVGQTVTSGIISALARSAGGISDFNFFIQTDAAINPGNSGGALITMDGRLVGINTAIYSRSGGSVGIGFAIPSNMVATVVRSAETGGKVERPWLGASLQDLTADLAISVGLSRPTGVIVGGVYPGGPADRAGIRVGDVILEVNGREIYGISALNFRIGTLKPGGVARLRVLRDGEKQRLVLELAKAPENPLRNTSRLKGRHPFSGSVVANLSPALAEELSINMMLRGVMILELRPKSPAHRIGLRPGDVILTVNGKRINRVKMFREILAHPPRVWRVSLRRGDQTLSFAVES